MTAANNRDKNGTSVSTAEETSPLLAVSGGTPNAGGDETVGRDGHARNDEAKPFPRTQILLLCFARIVEPIAFFSIFPFVNQMIWETGNVKESDVGFYSGLIVSVALSGAAELVIDTVPGVLVLLDPDVVYDTLGPSSGSFWQEACSGILFRLSGRGHSRLWIEQDDMGDDCFQMLCRRVCRYYRVSRVVAAQSSC